MKKNPLTIIIGLLLIFIFALLLFVFQVRKTEVGVVTTFGEATRDVTQPGAYLKWPWPIQKVHKFDQRIHSFESKFGQVLTADGYNLLIMVYVGWNITEPKIFFPRFGESTARAEEALDGLIRNVYSGVIGRHPFSHFISTDERELKFVEIEQEMLQRLQTEVRANQYGLDIKFLGVKRLGLPESVTKLVFERMQSERQVQVSRIQFEGEREASHIRSAADLESAKILSEAEAEATKIRGEGEKLAAESLQVLQQNPELANFLLNLAGLESFLKDRAVLILDTKTPPLDLLGREPSAALKR